jgi:hypothetical protein
MHVPVEQAAVAFANAHACPHIPQLATSDRTVVSQPFAALPSQSPSPGGHAIPHTPAVHEAVPFVPDGHTIPHAPQFIGSVCVATQRVPQMVG